MIVAAAIKLTNGLVFTAPSHALAYVAAMNAGYDLDVYAPTDISGYVEQDGRWVNYSAPHLAPAVSREGLCS